MPSTVQYKLHGDKKVFPKKVPHYLMFFPELRDNQQGVENFLLDQDSISLTLKPYCNFGKNTCRCGIYI